MALPRDIDALLQSAEDSDELDLAMGTMIADEQARRAEARARHEAAAEERYEKMRTGGSHELPAPPPDEPAPLLRVDEDTGEPIIARTGEVARMPASLDEEVQAHLVDSREFGPRPPADPEMEALGAYGAAAAHNYAGLSDEYRRRYSRKVHDPTGLHDEFGEYSGEARRLQEEEARAAQLQHEAAIEARQRAAKYYDDEVERVGEEIGRTRARDDESRKLQSAQRARYDELQGEVTRLRQSYLESPDIDPERFWNSRTGAQKFLMGLSAALFGFGGRRDPFQLINEGINRDIDAQKANLAKRRQAIGNALDQTRTEQAQQGVLMDTSAEQRARDLVTRKARFEEAQARLAKMQEDAGITVESALAQQTKVQLGKAINDLDWQLEQMALLYPESKTVSGYVHTGRDAEVFRAQMGEALKDRKMTRETFGRVVSDRDKARIKGMSDSDRGGLTPEAFASSLRAYGKNTAAHQDMKRRAMGFLQKYPAETDIPGVKKYTWQRDDPDVLKFWDTSDRQEARSEMDRAFQAYKTAVTGAGASVEEIKMIEKALFGAKTEDAVRAAFQEMLDSAETHMGAFRKGTPDAVLRYYDRRGVQGAETGEDLGLGEPTVR